MVWLCAILQLQMDWLYVECAQTTAEQCREIVQGPDELALLRWI